MCPLHAEVLGPHQHTQCLEALTQTLDASACNATGRSARASSAASKPDCLCSQDSHAHAISSTVPGDAASRSGNVRELGTAHSLPAGHVQEVMNRPRQEVSRHHHRMIHCTEAGRGLKHAAGGSGHMHMGPTRPLEVWQTSIRGPDVAHSWTCSAHCTKLWMIGGVPAGGSGDVDVGLATPLEVYQSLAAEGFQLSYRRIPLSRERTPEAADLDTLHSQMQLQPDEGELDVLGSTRCRGSFLRAASC